ncbi:MAG: hypothetical protein GF329_20100, partial [Candidatus Lokiarchaeota archaeon]|nr:hypothetical protein [Candidatus Lokiarchaeota archaeon]
MAAKITFDCASNTFQVWINGKQAYIGSNHNLQFENGVSKIDKLEISNAGNKGDRKFWLDAIDFSWVWGYYEN